MIQLKLTKIGNSVGVVLPKELLAQLKVGLGDTLFCSEVPDGVKMTAYDENIAEDLSLAEDIMRSRRNVLRALAK
jgi:putative addiction module antidote